MSIDIKQMVIKSNIVQREEDCDSDCSCDSDTEQLRETMLAECRRLVQELFNARKER